VASPFSTGHYCGLIISSKNLKFGKTVAHTFMHASHVPNYPSGAYSTQSVSAAEAVSWSIGHNPGMVATPMQDTRMARSSQQAGTHFADLRRMTG